VEQIADRIAIVDGGRTVVAGGLDDLRERYRRVRLVFDGAAPAVTFTAPGVTRVRRDGRVITLLSAAGTGAILEEARALGPASLDVSPISLKDLFLDTVLSEE
jgi:ABC-2 type transport system ATP-binding protein